MTTKEVFNLPIGPGLYTEQTERGAVGRWYKADKVRFRKGLAEKIGGWVRLDPQFLGVCRRLKDWSSLDRKQWAAVATDTKLYLWQDEVLYDITPIRDSGTLTAPFDTVDMSFTVTVNHTNHNAQLGDYVRFSNAIAGGGLTVDGEYRIQSIIDIDSYTIIDDEEATSTANNTGGTPNYEYDISAGASSAVTATGYGTGPYGREGWGNARTGSTLVLGIRTWALDTWGEDLLASPSGGAIYWWDRSKGTGVRAVALGGDAPPNNEYMLISQRDRHVIALGAFDFFNNAFDPLLIRWSSTEDLNDWVPTATNTSGDLRLYSGSKIVTGVRSRLETVIFTDVSVHTLPFVGGFDVFGLNIVGENVSILGPNCAVPIDHRVLFMAESDFYVYDGILRVIPCDVRNFVYDNLNVAQKAKVYGGLNREFNEVWWFYPSGDPEAWVQQDFSLGLPSGMYSEANASSTAGDPLFSEVQLLAHFDGTDGSTVYQEESSNNQSATFVGAAELDTGQIVAGTASLLVVEANAGDYVTFPDNSGFHINNNDFTVEAYIIFNSLPIAGEEWCIVSQWVEGTPADESFALSVVHNAGELKIRGYADGTFEQSSLGIVPTLGVIYHIAMTGLLNGGLGDMGLYFNGSERFDSSFAIAYPVTNSSVPLKIGTRSPSIGGSEAFFDGTIDEVRFTNGTARYASPTYSIPPIPLNGAPSSGDIGYTYVFNSGGWTEITNTADNGYAYDYFITNDEPVITPSESEYAMEFAFNGLGGAATRWGGLVFLRTDITGPANTTADDAQAIYIEADFFTDTLRVRKKDDGGVKSVMDNDPGTTTFAAVTSAAVQDTNYIITVSFDTPTITVFLDGVQVWQFDLSAAELLLYTGGSYGFHAEPAATIEDEFKFFNLSTGPVGVLTSTTFDISPIEVNRYVIYNYEEQTWATGQLARTAWADRSPLLEKAYAAGTDNFLYKHETGTDDNGTAMVAFIESFDMEIPSAGESLMHVDQLIPDFLTLEGSVDVFLTGKKYPGVIDRIEKGPYPVVPGTRKLSTRMRARQIAIKVQSDGTGDRWRMGHWRGRAGAHGKRG
jgi:hypothetical protein